MTDAPVSTLTQEDLRIRDFKHWSLYLNPDQSYLGRVCLVARREDALDFLEMTRAERRGFFRAGRKVRRALADLFQPDLFNYASLGNVYRHLHVHIIPRYRGARVFHQQEFSDPRWGQSYEGREPARNMGDETLLAIRGALRAALV